MQHDPCLFYKKNIVYILYTDDSIIAGLNKNKIKRVIQQIGGTSLQLTEDGDLADFLGIKIHRHQDGKFELKQTHLIDQIIGDLYQHYAEAKDTPSSTTILRRQEAAPTHDSSFHYKSIIGKLNYVEGGARPDLSYSTHQCAWFSVAPKTPHAHAVRRIGRYLCCTRDKGIIMSPDLTKGPEVNVDADFAGNWNREDYDDSDVARSRHGYIIS